MITHPAYAVDPWGVRESSLDLSVLAQSESVFALSNGHIGVRGNLDEGEPNGLPGTYLNGFCETWPLPYAEGGFGYPESGETVVNVTNGKIIRLLVDDEPFDVRYGRLLSHERFLDFRTGVLQRRTEWQSPAGRSIRVSSTRLVSFSERAVAAIQYEVEPVDARCRLVIQSELVANETLQGADRDPRLAAALSSALVSEGFWPHDTRVVLVHHTRASGLRIGASMDHIIEAPEDVIITTESHPNLGRVIAITELEAGQRLRVVKFISYGWSSVRSTAAMRDQVAGALVGARRVGWDGLLADQRSYLDDFWNRADVEIEGDEELQQAVRFALFHVLQSGARGEQRAIPAKGLTGPGYDGHAFWDSESFVLRVLTYTASSVVADALRWRQATLPLARERAQVLGLRGAAFPWRTIRGRECSAYWPAGMAAFHVNADVANAVVRYQDAADDKEFERETGVELLVETARLWCSLGHHDAEGHFRIAGVTGPDDYSALADNNVYTNLMAQRNLHAAAEAVEQYPDRGKALGVDSEEAAAWRAAAAEMVVPYDASLGVHPQSEGFTSHQRWDFAHTRPEQYPLLLHFPYFDIYRKQVVKQADLILALHLRGDAFTREEKLRDFEYYEALTVRDSSLSACTQAVVAAEVGHLELAYDYFGEAALMDLLDLDHDLRDGVHIASLAGAWIAAVAGFGGMRDHDGNLSFTPRLPERLARLAFRLTFRGRLLKVEVTQGQATYAVLEGSPLDITHHGKRVTVHTDAEVTRPIPGLPSRRRPAQPHGRAPARRDFRLKP
ncbi:MAG: family 65 glycosyl hydrolase [Candidatus Dormibacteraeota bacterium]|nr:family 65 glycosyl hydrolase [Candidatus Dormibacteraeota bacterium]